MVVTLVEVTLANGNVSQQAASGNVNGLELAALACISSQASLASNCPVGTGTANLANDRSQIAVGAHEIVLLKGQIADIRVRISPVILRRVDEQSVSDTGTPRRS